MDVGVLDDKYGEGIEELSVIVHLHGVGQGVNAEICEQPLGLRFGREAFHLLRLP